MAAPYPPHYPAGSVLWYWMRYRFARRLARRSGWVLQADHAIAPGPDTAVAYEDGGAGERCPGLHGQLPLPGLCGPSGCHTGPAFHIGIDATKRSARYILKHVIGDEPWQRPGTT